MKFKLTFSKYKSNVTFGARPNTTGVRKLTSLRGKGNIRGAV